jgi:serine/threonine protein kinase
MSDDTSMELPVQFGKYQLVELIGYGGMAEIFKAKSYGVSGFEKTIVIKRILSSCSDDQDFINMLIDEAKICARLQHANIVQIFDLGRLEGRYFIAMEYIHGVDLIAVLTRLKKAKRQMPQELACYIMSEALKGLDHAHRATDSDGQRLGIVHRDFNPSNILLSYQGEVKVADFGIAKAVDRGTKTKAGGLKGKMGYLSPEQVEDKALDPRSDVFTAGITFWEMLCCQRMFVGGADLDILLRIRDAKIPDISQYAPDVPIELQTILLKSLQKSPKDRFRSAGELKTAIDDYLFDKGTKVDASHLEGYLKHLFADRLEEEKSRTKIAVEHSLLPTPEESEPEAVADYQGKIAEVSFPKLFYRLGIAEELGRLVLTRPGVKKEIFIRQGLPEFVKSDMPSERLGEYLIAMDAISAEQRNQAVSAMEGFSGRLGDTLIGLGIIRPHELFEHLQAQVREKIFEVFSWTTGVYQFFSKQTYAGEVIPLNLGNFELIIEGIRRYTSYNMLRNRYRSKMDLKVKRQKNPYLAVNRLCLTAREQRVVNSINQGISLREIMTVGGSDRGEFEKAVYRIIYVLDELEMLEFSPMSG